MIETRLLKTLVTAAQIYSGYTDLYPTIVSLIHHSILFSLLQHI